MLRQIKYGDKFTDKVIQELERHSNKNTVIPKFLYENSRLTNVYIIGGFLRSIANNITPRDVDVIMNLGAPNLQAALDGYSLPWQKNKLGGYKITLNSFKLDIWSIDDNWAFKNKLIANYNQYTEEIINKIAAGTFFNYDSLVFDIRSERYNFKHYNDCVKSNTLDIIRKGSKYQYGNPGKFNNVLRAFLIRRQTGLNFSKNVCTYIVKHINNTGITREVEMINFFSEMAGKESRYASIAKPKIIEECLQHISSQMKNYMNLGDQFSLFFS